jgi:hypothetical protein
MPPKSRRKRGKNLPPSKRIKVGTGSSSLNIEEEAFTDPIEPLKEIEKPASKSRVNAPAAETVASYPYVKSELINIGILAVIMLVILGILGAVL